MNEKTIIFCQIFLFLFFSNINSIISLPCENYSFCFDCISDNTCTWDHNECQAINELKNTKPHFNTEITPKKCFQEKDNLTLDYISTYCGNLFYYFNEEIESISLSLPIHNNTLYGAKSLYCEYIIYNSDEIESFTIHTIKIWGKLKMQIKYYYSENIREIILGDGDRNVIKNSEEIKIIFESNNIGNTSPFMIKIQDTFRTFNKIKITIISSCSFLGFIIILIICIIFIKRRRRIIINNNINNLNNFYFNNVNIINNDITTSERVDLMLYLKKVKTIKFKEIKNNIKDKNDMKCPIDMEQFELEDDVILTECLHIFHYDCIKTFIEKNRKLKELKCPLCNRSLFSTIVSNNDIESNNDNAIK